MNLAHNDNSISFLSLSLLGTRRRIVSVVVLLHEAIAFRPEVNLSLQKKGLLARSAAFALPQNGGLTPSFTLSAVPQTNHALSSVYCLTPLSLSPFFINSSLSRLEEVEGGAAEN